MNEFFFSSYIFSSISIIFSYIGPGMAGGAIAAIFGLIAAFFLGLWGILYYPIKRAIKNRQIKKKTSSKKNNQKR